MSTNFVSNVYYVKIKTFSFRCNLQNAMRKLHELFELCNDLQNTAYLYLVLLQYRVAIKEIDTFSVVLKRNY